jgi:hypothetical protein
MSNEIVTLPEDYNKFLSQWRGAEHVEHVDVPVQHDLHGGMMARTLFVKAGTAAMGCIHAIDSLTIIQGHLYLRSVSGTEEVKGFGVFPCSAGQWRAIYALEDSIITTVIPTQHKSLADLDKIMEDSVMNHQDIASKSLPLELQ